MEKSKAEPIRTTEAKSHTHEPRNFLAAFLLVLSFGPMGVNRLYTGETTLGWIRFGMFAAGMILSPVFVGWPLLIVSQIWGWVDVFLVYHGGRTDADGKPMAQNLRDRKVAKILYILFVISLILGALILIGFVIFITILGINGESFMHQNGSDAVPPYYDYGNRNY
jgi:TM2 domain-containing membrane protein YozV